MPGFVTIWQEVGVLMYRCTCMPAYEPIVMARHGLVRLETYSHYWARFVTR